MKISKSWLRMAEIYKIFGQDPFMTKLDFSEQAKQEMYEFESTGKGNISLDMFSNSFNGYAYGKKMLNITVAMWKEDIEKGLLFLKELYYPSLPNDAKFPHWWLNKIFNRKNAVLQFQGLLSAPMSRYGLKGESNGKK
jgi:hypothetical protein